jgi:Holliday junction resolvase
MGNTKGSRGERELRDLFDGREYAVIRAAGSGSAPGFDLPDLFVGDGARQYALEVKRKAPSKVRYLTEEEANSLLRFAEYFPLAKPRAAVRWDGDTEWYFADPLALPETDSGARQIHPDERGADYYATLDDVAPPP